MMAMLQEFDGVRELSMEKIEAVAGGPVWVPVALGVAAVFVLATKGRTVEYSQTTTGAADGSTSTTNSCSASRR